MRPYLAPPPTKALVPGTKPSFSVVIAVYQAAHTVGEAVASALGQTHPPLEVIVCDDGSTDRPEAALAPYRDRIVFLRRQNGGPAAARNAGFRIGRGDFVAILDADDVFLPNRLEALAELAAARPDLDILTTDASMEFEGRTLRRVYDQGWTFDVEDQRVAILERNFIYAQAAVRRRALLAVGGMDESFPINTNAEDWDLWIRMIFTGSRAGLVDEPLARYRLSEGSLSSRRARHLAGKLATLEKAARRTDLSLSERETIARSLTTHARDRALANAREALLDGRSDARRQSLAVAFGRSFELRTRAKALASALAPGRARRKLAQQGRETTAGIRLPPNQGDR